MPWWISALVGLLSGGVGVQLVMWARSRHERHDQEQDRVYELLQRQITSLQRDLGRQEERIKSLEAQLAEEQRLRHELRSELQRLLMENQALTMERDALKSRVSEQDGEIRGLRDRLERAPGNLGPLPATP